MVRTPLKKAGGWLAIGALTLLVASAFAPLAAAEEHERERKDRRAPAERPMANERMGEDVTISLSGTATAKDNTSYAITIEGKGKARSHEREGNLTAIHGVGVVFVQIKDADGSVIKEGRTKAKVLLVETEDGEWKFALHAVGKRPRGMPNFMLRGSAEPTDAGFSIEAAGKGLVRLADDERRSVLDLKVEGIVARAAA